MHSIQSLILAATAFSIHAAALPATSTVAAAAATRSCNPVKTFTAKFDALAPSATLTPGFGGISWSGFTVASFYTTYGINATSGHNVAVLPVEGASMTGLFELTSFTFACVAQLPEVNGAVFPNPCTIQLVVVPASAGLGVEMVGPFTYSPGDFIDTHSANMTRVVPTMEAASAVWWNVIDGPGSTRVLIDNVVIETQQNCPAS